MIKPDGYDNVKAATFGSKIDPGPYVMKIISADEVMSNNSGPMLVLCLDIAIGENKDHYKEMSNKYQKENYQKVRQLTGGASLPYFKAMIEAIEESNNGFKFNFDEKTLVGKYVGANLREEEYINSNNELKTFLSVAYLCGARKVVDGEIKPLPKKVLETNNHLPMQNSNDDVVFEDVNTSFNNDRDDDLPF